MAELIDNAIALRIIYLLITPFNRTDAFKFGIIDETGKPLKKASQLKTNAERDSYSMLHRLVFRIKRVIGTLPFGQTNLASYAAAYALVKEHYIDNNETDDLEELFVSLLNTGEDGLLNESKSEFNRLLKTIEEDGEAPTNTTAGIESSFPFMPKKNIKKYQKANQKFKFKNLKSRKIFSLLPKESNTLYKINEDLIFIE